MSDAVERAREKLEEGIDDLERKNEELKGWSIMLAGQLAEARKILDAILAADERGQGIPFSEAMDAADQWMKNNQPTLCYHCREELPAHTEQCPTRRSR